MRNLEADCTGQRRNETAVGFVSTLQPASAATTQGEQEQQVAPLLLKNNYFVGISTVLVDLVDVFFCMHHIDKRHKGHDFQKVGVMSSV